MKQINILPKNNKKYKVGQALLESLKIEVITDEFADLEYLDQFKDSADPEEQKYYVEDQKRKEAYNNNEWYCVGIKATAEILIPSDNNACYQTITISSPGIWGIETDSPKSTFKEHAENEIEELKYTLNVLNVWTGGEIIIFKGSKAEKQLIAWPNLVIIALKEMQTP